jgi:hypothetical protein
MKTRALYVELARVMGAAAEGRGMSREIFTPGVHWGEFVPLSMEEMRVAYVIFVDALDRPPLSDGVNDGDAASDLGNWSTTARRTLGQLALDKLKTWPG